MTGSNARAVPAAPVPGVHETSTLYTNGAITPMALVERVLDRRLDDRSFIQVTGGQALIDASRATTRRRSGRSVGRLDGLPIGVKDCIDVAGVVTTNGSLVARSAGPAKADAGIVRMLRGRGAVVVGKTNQSELAFSGLGMNPHFGSPKNPVPGLEARVTGGSSSGSASAVAAGHVALAIGTDTSGSVRVPAAFCGVVGYKASDGRFPLDGIRPLSPTLDSVGILTRTVKDLKYAVDALAPSQTHSGSTSDHMLFVVPDDEIVTACEPEVRAWFHRQIDELDRLDGVIVEARRLPVLAEAQELMDAHGTLVAAEAYGLYGRYLLAGPANELDSALARRLGAAALLGPDIEVVRRALPILRRRLARELDGALLLSPTVRHRPPLIDEARSSAAAFDALNARTLRTTMVLSYLGMPGVTVPSGTGRSLGIGLLVSGPWGDDDRVLDAAVAVEGADLTVDADR